MSVLWSSTRLLLCLALLVGCGQSPRLAPLPGDAVILAFGDSLTYGTGASNEQSYPAVLETLVGRRVVGAGVPGELSAQGVARLPELLDEHRPRLLILCHGGNDLLRRTGEDQAAANLRRMVRMALDRGVAVVLVAVPKPGLVLSPPDYYQEVASEFRLPLEAQALSEILSDSRLKSDPAHPNARGYEKLARAIAELLKKSGAV